MGPIASAHLRKRLKELLDDAVLATDADFGSLQLVDPTDNSLRIVAHRGFAAEALRFFRVIKEDKSSCHAALVGARQVVVADVRSSPYFTEPARRVMLASRLCACQSTPIRSADGSVIGMVSTHFRTVRRPTRAQLRLVDTLAREAAQLIESGASAPPPFASRTDAILDDYRSRRSDKLRPIED